MYKLLFFGDQISEEFSELQFPSWTPTSYQDLVRGLLDRTKDMKPMGFGIVSAFLRQIKYEILGYPQVLQITENHTENQSHSVDENNLSKLEKILPMLELDLKMYGIS
jgi:hypothetical protein